jgi:hypothetical protein
MISSARVFSLSSILKFRLQRGVVLVTFDAGSRDSVSSSRKMFVTCLVSCGCALDRKGRRSAFDVLEDVR